MSKRAEVDTHYEVAHTTGSAQGASGEDDEQHQHAFLYLPDLSSRTGWASHAVPERREKPRDRQPMGFRR